MAVDAWTLRARVSLCTAGTHDNSTAAPWVRSLNPAIVSASESRRG